MEKLQYLLWLPEDTSRTAVKPLMVDRVGQELLAGDIRGLTIDLDDDDADVTPPVPAPTGEHIPRRSSRSGSTVTTGGLGSRTSCGACQ